MDFPDFSDPRDNIRVKIIEAHNVYINYPYPKEDNSDDTQKGKPMKTNSSVQTEPDENETEWIRACTQSSRPNKEIEQKYDVKTQELLSGNEEGQSGSSTNVEFSGARETTTAKSYEVEKLTQQFNCLPLGVSNNPQFISTREPVQEKATKIPSSGILQEGFDLNKTKPLQTGNNKDTPITVPSVGEITSTNPKDTRPTSRQVINGDTRDKSGNSLQSARSPLDLFSSAVERCIPYIVNKAETQDIEPIKVIIVHSDSDKNLAEEIVSKLRENRKIYAAASYELGHIISIGSADLRKAAIDWADILVPLISDSWLSEIENVNPSQKSTSLSAKYMFQLIHSNYLSVACVNSKIVAAVKEGTSRTYRERPEIRNAILVMKEYEKFERMVINMHRASQILKNLNSKRRRSSGQESTNGGVMSTSRENKDKC